MASPTDDPTFEESKGPTPAGGVRSRIDYLNDAGESVPKSKSTKAVIVEFDANGNPIRTTYGSLGR
jgi:hypothetical protein